MANMGRKGTCMKGSLVESSIEFGEGRSNFGGGGEGVVVA